MGGIVGRPAGAQVLQVRALGIRFACIRHASDEIPFGELDSFNSDLHRRLVRETKFFPSTTVVDGHFAVRPCFINPRTTSGDVEEFLAAVVDIGDQKAAGR